MKPGLSLKEECEIKRREASRDQLFPGERIRERSPIRMASNRTDSDDPKLLNARVFLGNLATDKTSRAELEEKFSKYGNVIGATIFRGFGFIQFDNESDARKAVEQEKGGLFKGQRLDVKMAAEGRKGGAGRGRRSPPPDRGRRDDREFDRRPGPPPARERSPPGRRDRSPISRPRREDPYDRHDPYPEDPYRRAPPPARDPYYERLHDDPYRREAYAPPPAPYHRDLYRDPYAALPPPLPAAGYEPPPLDCEILMTSRNVREYAESIRMRLKESGLIAELVALADEAALKPAMDGVNRRKLPFAIVLNQQNEIHRSCTVSILHGTPQEHRNMPLDDAMNLVARSFETYLKEQKEKTNKKVVGQYQHLPPEAQMQYLLNLLADNHYLTAEELSKVIDYLQDRKRRLLQYEGGTDGMAQEQEKAANKEQKELQAKILSILGPDANTAAAAETQVSRAPGAAVKPAAFENPNVQRAIDNLMSGGGLRNINNAGSQESAAPSLVAGVPPPRAVAYPDPYAAAPFASAAGQGYGY